MLWHPKTLQNLAMYNVFFICLTYLFRLCFRGYFQIFVSPETFWLKDFNLVLRFSCCFNQKKQTEHVLQQTTASLFLLVMVTVWVDLFATCFSLFTVTDKTAAHPGVARACNAGFASSEPGVDRNFCIPFQIRVVHTHSFLLVRSTFRRKNIATGYLAFQLVFTSHFSLCSSFSSD